MNSHLNCLENRLEINFLKKQLYTFPLIACRYSIFVMLCILAMPLQAQMVSDKDNDGIPDLLDLDSDNDGISDIDEGVICEIVDLDELFPLGSLDAINDFNDAQIVVGGVNGALIQVDTSFAGGATLDEFEISNRHTGNQNGLLLGVNSEDPSQTLSEEYSFTELVCDFSITVFDLDRTDAIIVEGTNGGVPVTFTLTNVGGCIEFDGVSQLNSGPIDDCNVQVEPGNGDIEAHSFTLQFDDCIDNMTLTYFDLGPGSGGSFTFVPTPFPTCSGPDTDGDGLIDAFDLDSDNDGIPDAIEACGMINLVLEDCSLDSNGDGVFQMENGESTGILVNVCAEAPIDTDMDGIPDFLDLDSDGDGCPDAVEACTNSNPNVNDSSISDAYDMPAAAINECGLVIDADGVSTSCENPPSDNYINADIGCLEATLTFIQDITCFGDNDGSASVQAMDGNQPYTYLWAPSGETTPVATMLQPGINTVTVTDACDETVILTIDIQEPTLVELDFDQGNIACNGESTGSILIDATGGTPAYTFLWNDGVTTQDRMNIPAGTFTVTATDANGCTAMTSITLTEPPPLVTSTDAVNILCNGDATGSIDLMVVGGVSPYTFLWNDGVNTEDRNNIPAGTFTVTVTDQNDCTISTSVTITEPPLLVASTTQVDILCNGDATGSINLSVVGGVMPYTFLWNDGVSTEDRNNIPAGDYMVTVTDQNNCTMTTAVTLTEPPLLVPSTTQVDILCNGDATGSINLTVVGGVSPFSFLWNDGVSTEDRNNIPAGNYTVTITDQNNCTTTTAVTLTEPPLLVPSTTQVDILCNGDATGSINLSVVGGVMPYTFLWNDGVSSEDRSNIPAGDYTVTITDQNNCTTTTSVTLTEPPLIVLSTTQVDILCNGDATGSINLTVVGGVTPYSFMWNDGVSSEDRNNIPAGDYMVTVTDQNNCTMTTAVTITEPPLLVPSTTQVDILCNGDATGSIDLTVIGGVSPYSFLWNDGINTEDRNNIPAGDYTVTITDQNNCTTSTSVTLTEPPLIVLSTTQVDILCNGDATGSINLTVVGGVTPYSFMWNDGVSSEDRNNIPAGDYMVTVTDQNNCTMTTAVTLTEPPLLELSTTQVDILCNGDATGSINATITGGTLPFTFAWSTGQITEDLTNIPAGSYVLTVTDANGCIVDTEVTLTEPTELVCSTTNDINAICSLANGVGTVAVVGGVAPYLYNWDNGETTATASSLTSGLHMVTVTDSNGCDLVCDVTIGETCSPCLEIIKSSSLDEGADNVATPSDVVTYTYQIMNCGDVTITDISIGEDPILFTGTGSLPLPMVPANTDLAPSESITVEAEYNITLDDINAGFIDNQAIADGLDPDGNRVDDLSDTGNANDVNETGGSDDPTNTPIDELPCIELTKSSTIDLGIDGQLSEGDIVTYAYEISNCGNVTLDNVSISEDDILFTGTGPVPMPNALLVTTLDPGESTSTSANYTITQVDIDAGFIDNQAITEAVSPSGATVDDLSDTTNPGDINETGGPDDPTNTPLDQDPCIVLSKGSLLDLGPNGVANPGDIITYTYELTNCGNVTLSNVVVTEDPALFTGTGILPTPTTPPSVLAPNASATLSSTYAITQIDIDAGFIDNQAVASATDPDGILAVDLSDTSNPEDINETGGPDDPTNTPIGETPCIEIVKGSILNLGADGISTPGDIITYSYTIINCGNTTLSGISLSESSDLFTGTGTLPSPATPSTTTLSPGEEATSSATYAITQEDIDAGLVDNQALVSGTSPAGNTTMDESDTSNEGDINETGGPDDPTNTPIPQEPCIEVVKSSTLDLGINGASNPGDVITYEYTISNCGNVTLEDVSLIEEAILFSGTGTLPTIAPLTTTTLSPGQETSTTATYAVTQEDIDSAFVDNQATVSGTPPSDQPISDLSDTGNADDINETGGPDDPTNTPIPQESCIELLKSSTVDAGIDVTTTVGDIISYDYVIINCGTVTLNNIILSEDAALFTGTGNLPVPSAITVSSLEPGESTTASATYAITQADIDEGDIDNQAIVESEDPFGDPVSDLSDTQNPLDVNETGGPDDPTNTPLPNGSCIVVTKGSLIDLGPNGISDPGDIITYTYVVTNCGNVTISNVSLVEDDALFSGTGILPTPATPSAELTPNESTIVTSTYAITQMDIDAGFVDNQAIATANDPDGNVVNDLSDTSNPTDVNETGGPDDPTNTPIGESPCIEIIKESSLNIGFDGIATPGDIINYNYTIINCGNTTLSGISLSESAALFSGTGTLPVPFTPSPTILSPGQESTSFASYEITQEDIDAGLVDNQAIVSGTSPAGLTTMDVSDTGNTGDVNETGGPDDPTNTPIPQEPCIEVVKSSSLDIGIDATSTVGDIITYEYEISNCGNVTLADIDLAEEASLFSGTGILPNILPLTAATLSPGQMTTTTSTYAITQADINAAFVDNQAIASGTPPFGASISDPSDTGNPGDVNETGGPDDPTNTPIPQDGCIELLKSSTFEIGVDGSTNVGDVIIYDYVILNCGTVTLTNVSLSEDASLFSGSGPIPLPSPLLITTLDPGESTTSSASYVITQADIDEGSVDNQAIVTSEDPTGNPVIDVSDTNNPNDINETGGPNDPTNTPLDQDPCIALTKGSLLDLGPDGVASPGDIITYTFELTNCGNVTLSNVTLTEDGNLFTGTGTLPVPTTPPSALAPNESATLTSTYAITQMDIDAGSIDNQAIATSSDPDGNPVDDLSDTSNPEDANETGGPDDPTNTPIGETPCIELIKESALDIGADGTATPGDIITYTYTIINCGNTTLSGITIMESSDLFSGTGPVPTPSAPSSTALSPGEEATSSATYALTQEDIDAGIVENQATASGTSPAGNSTMDESDTGNENDPNETGGPDDPTSTLVPQVPCIEIVKSSSLDLGIDATSTVGDIITYEYVISNCGNVTLADIDLAEEAALFSGTGTLPNILPLTAATLSPGQTTTTSSTYAITQADINAASIDNQAIASGTPPFGASISDPSDTGNPGDVNETGGPDDPTNTPIPQDGCIELLKSSTFETGVDGSTNVGDVIIYDYIIINCGTVTLTNVSLSEDASLFSGSGPIPLPSPLLITTLDPGESTTSSASYVITQADIDEGSVDNQAIVTSEDPTGNPVTDVSDTNNPNDINETGGPNDPTNTPLDQDPCIALTKGSLLQLGPDGVASPGDIITYTFELTNCGNVTLSNVTLTEDGALFTGTGILPVPTTPPSVLAPNESATLTSTYTITQMDIDAGSIDNQAIAASTDPDGNPVADLSDTSNPEDANETGGPDDPTNTPIGETPCIELIKESTLNLGADVTASPGDIITYTYTIINCGNTTLSGISIIELADSFSGTGPVPTPSTPSSTTLSPGEEATSSAIYALTQEDIDAGIVENQAAASGTSPAGNTTMDESDTGNENDPNETGGPDDPTSTLVPQVPCIEIIKSSSLDLGIDGLATVGDIITYEYVISNCGNVTVEEIDLVEETALFSGTGILPSILPLTTTTLSPGQTTTTSSTYAITQVDIDVAFVDNQAIASGNPPFGGSISDPSDTGNPGDVNETGGPDDPTNTPIGQQPCIELLKSSTFDVGLDGVASVGDIITYDYVIINCGTVTLNNISLSEDATLFSGSGTLPIPSDLAMTTLEPGQTTTATATYVITQTDIDEGSIDNQAIVTSEDPSGNPVTDISDTNNPNDINETGGPNDPTNTPFPTGSCIVVTKGSLLDLGANNIADPGDIISYTFVITNCGNVTLSNVTLTEDATLFTGTGTLPTPIAPTTVLAPGQSVTAASTYAITQMDIDAGFIDNQVIASAVDPDGNAVNDLSDTSNPEDANETGGPDDPTNTPISNDGCIETLKGSMLDLGDDNRASVGDIITYNYEIINCGNTTLSGISIVELDAMFTGTGLLPIPSTPVPQILAPGETAISSATYILTQADIDAGGISNQALGSGTGPDGEAISDSSDSSNPNDPNDTGGPDDPTFTDIPQIPCVESIKSSNFNLGPDNITNAGDIIVYTYTIINCGNVTVNNISIEETVAGFTGTGALPIINDLIVTTLSPGQETTTTGTYQVTQEDIDTGFVDNQALISGDTPLGDPIEDLSDTGNPDDVNETGGPDDPTNTPLEELPCISVLKGSMLDVGADGIVSPGDVITYSYEVTNCGNVTLTDIDIVEDSNLFTGSGTLPIPEASMPINLVPGETATSTATYIITQQDIDSGSVDNQAIASGNDPEGNPITDVSDSSNDNDINETGGPDDPTNTPLEELPCIAIIKSSVLDLGDDNIANPGDQITYTYEVSNCGNITLTNITIVEDELFSGAGLPPVILPIVPSTLAPGESITTSATYTLLQADVNAGFITNQAIATGQDPSGTIVDDMSDTGNEADPTETGGPDDPTFTDIPQLNCITLEKSSSLLINESTLPSPGDIIEYTFEVVNCGNVTLTNFSLEELETAFTGTGSNFVLEFIPIDLLDPNESFVIGATYEITQEDIDAGSIDNQALITSDNPLGTSITDLSDTANPGDINETGGPDDPTNTPLPNANCIELIKSSVFILGDNQQANPGDMIIYTYEYSNCGNTTLTNIAITEDDILFTGAGDPPVINLTVTTLLPGQSESVEAIYIVSQADLDAGSIDNQALATATTPDDSTVEDLSDTGNPNDANETGGPDDPTSTEIGISPCIELLKSSEFTSTIAAEGNIVYTYTIRNCGNVTLTNIELIEREELFSGTNQIPVITPSTFSVLQVGETMTATSEYEISIEDVVAGSVDNQALVTAQDPQGDTVEDFSDTANPIDINETGGPNDPTNTVIDILSTVTGTVFEDLDGNMTEDIPIGEGITVSITDQAGIVQVTTTDTDGIFVFENVIPGVVVIEEIDPDGFNSVGDTDGDNDNIITVFVLPSDMSVDNDFIDEEPADIFGNVSEDEGADLTADVPLANVLVTLIDRDSMIFTTLTDVDGNFVFENINPGPFTLIETDPEDFSSVGDIDGGDPNVIINILMSGDDMPDQDFLDAQCDELICNGSLQISLNVDCEVLLEPDDVLEAPVPGDYTIALFDEHGEFIRNDLLTADEAGETIQYQITCLDNSCWGLIIVEANIIPEITSPCACTEDGTIPPECTLWCTPENTFPAGIISPEEATSRFGFCGPDLLGDISVNEIRTGDICADGGEIIELRYSGKVILHGQISDVDILCQRYSTLPINLDTNTFSFPNDINLDCDYLDDTDLGEEDFGSPLSISQATNSIINAYPHYINPHDSVPLVNISFDTTQVEVGQILRDTMVQEVIDGVEEWVLTTVVDKIFEDDISEIRDTTGLTPELIPIQDRVCNILSSFTDNLFEACGNGTKIIRTWELIDWCNSEVTLSGRQTIEIQDLTPPSIVELVNGELIERTTFDDVVVSIEAFRCQADVRLPRLSTSDNCDPEPTVVWQTDEGIVGANFITGLWLSDEPINVTAIVSDDCGNETSASFNFFVIDDVPPVASCETSLQISLTASASQGVGFADVSAIDLDEGSHDSGCGKVTFTAIRAEDWRVPVFNCDSTIAGFQSISCSENTVDVDLGTSDGKDGCIFDDSTIGTISSPGESVRFCCDDIGKVIPVILFVEDENGNVNQCIVNVEITDNSSPSIQCQDLTVNCSDGDALINPPLAGRLCNSEQTFSVDLLREIRANDACFGGSVIREWFIDSNGNNAFDSNEPFCRQVVTVTSEDSFNPYAIKWPQHFDGSSLEGINIEFAEGEIIETPATIEMGDVLECSPSAQSDEQGEFIPIWCGTDCGLVGISSETDTITAGDACLKLIKRWTIVDWCTFNANQNSIDDANDTSEDRFEAVEDWAQFEDIPNACESYSSMITEPVYFRYVDVDEDGFYTFDQVISVVDNQAPEITAQESIQVNTSGGATSKDDETLCTGDIIVSASAIDFCNSSLTSSTELRWQITVFNGSQIVLRENTTGPEAILSTLTGESSDELVVQWQVTDGCGNTASTQTLVEFIDQQAPTPFCIPGISTVFMRTDGTISLWAIDFDFGSFDNCTSAEDLRFSIVERGQRPATPDEEEFESQFNSTVHCSEINGLGSFDVWVWDIQGNGDFCSVDIVISDSSNACDFEAQGNIRGEISTSYGEVIADVNVTLSSNEQSEFPKQVLTNEQGQYSFSNNPIDNNYELNAEKDDEYINGLSTLDVFLITQHILNTAAIDDPYKIIAADANGDSQVTASDINTLRRLILGLDEELANQPAWIFIPSEFEIFDQTNPWPFVESIQIEDYSGASDDNDFVAIKMGDVNESYDQTEIRTSNEVTLEVIDTQTEIDQLVYVPIHSKDELIGFQFTLEFNGLDYVDVLPGKIVIGTDNIGVHENAISFSWNLTDSYDNVDEDELFTLVLKATDKTSLSKAMKLSSSITRAEAYSGSIYDVHPIALSIVSDEQNILIHQNAPNPFSEFTKIDFELKKSAEVSLSVFNLAGQSIYETSGLYTNGINSITISEENLSYTKGVLYYRLQIDGESYINRMISLD